jgi:hypothetical protein
MTVCGSGSAANARFGAPSAIANASAHREPAWLKRQGSAL